MDSKKKLMPKKGLTITMIFEAQSLNYGESIGCISSLKRMTRGDGESYSYLSRQALLYDIRREMGYDNSPLTLDSTVIQFAPDATIDKYPEVDLFGYMKTQKPTKKRSAVVRVSNAISLESFNSDLEFLTNKGLLDRYNLANKGNEKGGGNIAQSEIHQSFYVYTVTIDLDKVGIDENYDIELDNSEKANRVTKLLETIKMFSRDIKGRREFISPLFAIGGVYNKKNPFFENRVKLSNGNIVLAPISSMMQLDDEIKNNTSAGIISGIFANEGDIKETIKTTVEMGVFFKDLIAKVKEYYTENTENN